MKNQPKGSTFIELLFYMGIFLVLMPLLLAVAVNTLKTTRSYNLEKKINTDALFNAERIYDLITNAKRIDLDNSVLNSASGKLTVIDQNNKTVVVRLDPATARVQITEDGVTSFLTSAGNHVNQLYFEKIPDNLHDPEIALGINIRMKMTGTEPGSVEQSYVLSANLQRGDYDNDGCPDNIDLFPRHPECCGDADNDGICDEKDNCPLTYNPFQEDYNGNGIGDACDRSVFLGGGTKGNTQSLGAFNCSPDEDLINLITQQPPVNSSVLKSILLSSSPLSPDVLQALVDHYTILSQGHFLQIILNNVGLPTNIYNEVIHLNIPPGHIQQIQKAQTDNPQIVYYNYHNPITTYQQLSFTTDAPQGQSWVNKATFSNPDYPLCLNSYTGVSDIFVMDVENGSDSISVTTTTNSGSVTTNLTTDNNYKVNSQGFGIEFNERVGNAYAILISSVSCTQQLNSVKIDFGSGANILNPPHTDTQYKAVRYTSYCPGGCAHNCGDVGSGIATLNAINETCYKADFSYPEWCSFWYTFEDNPSDNPAFVGGTQIGQQTVYWEKTFKTIVNTLQLEHLQSITVTGDIAFQNMTQFFCDTLSASCPMHGALAAPQTVELYDFKTNAWVNIGATNVTGDTSNQQTFEIFYNGSNVKDFVGGPNNEQIKARLKFNWNGQATQGTSAPCFMLIDYFTVHLKW